jgi:integrase
MLTISRTAIQVNPKFHPTGERFLVKQYPKDREFRRVKVSEQLAARLISHILDANLGAEDLIFPMPAQVPPVARLRVVPDLGALGFTKPNAAGSQYRHGTMSAYNAGRCRCEHCKNAAAVYRAQRRADGKDSPRKPRIVDTDGHLSRDWFRMKVWRPALLKSKITFSVRPHDLRHAHASWLLAGGADLQMVKDRLGHGSITTTEKYLHTLPEADDIALDAFARIRNRAPGKMA